MREIYVKTEATTEPISLNEVKSFVGYNGSDSTVETMLEYYTTSARLRCEHFTGRNFAEKTMVLSDSEVDTNKKTGAMIKLPYGPVYEVSSIKIYDTYGVLDSTLTADDDYYILYDFDKVVRFESFFDGAYLKIEYTSGYGANTFTLPKPLRMALLQQIKWDYDHRGSTADDQLTGEVKAMLRPYQCSFL